jgi:AbiV family abortive infection protein
VAKRRVPTRDECITGIPIVLANADQHLQAADQLASAGCYGFGVAHLIYAQEEAEKARALGKIALGGAMTEDEIRRVLYDHRARHIGALAKSRSSGGAVVDFLADTLRERIGMLPSRTEAQRWVDVDARHPEILPPDWSEVAGAERERGIYVDLRDGGWTGPAQTEATSFERLRPSVVRHLLYVRAAYEREILQVAGRDT